METIKEHALRALRWSERYTKTDMVYLAKGGSWLMLGQAVGSFAALGLSIAFANLVSPEAFGTYKYVLSLAGTIGAFSLTGMGTAITRSVAQGYNGSLRAGFKTHLLWSTTTAVMSFAVAFYYFFNENTTLALAFAIVGITSPILASSALFSFQLQGEKDFRAETIYNIVRNIIPTGVVVATLFLTRDPLWIVASYFFSHTVITLGCYLKTSRRSPHDGQVDPGMVGYSKHLSVMNLLMKLAEGLDKILIFHFLGPVQLAIYSFAMTPSNQIKGVGKLATKLALPKFSGRPFEEIRGPLWHKIWLLLLGSVVVIVAYFVAAPYLFQLIFPQYMESVPYSQVFMLSLLFLPNTFLVQALVAHQKTKALYIINTVTPVLKIGLLLLLLPFYGLWGATASLVLIQAFGFVIVSYLFIKS